MKRNLTKLEFSQKKKDKKKIGCHFETYVLKYLPASICLPATKPPKMSSNLD